MTLLRREGVSRPDGNFPEWNTPTETQNTTILIMGTPNRKGPPNFGKHPDATKLPKKADHTVFGVASC